MRRGNSKNSLTLSSALILLLVAPACLADLMCYVCDDCAKVTKETPLLACNADFFNPGGSTEASTVTTTAATTTTTMLTSTTEEEPMSSTSMSTDSTGMPKTTDMSTTSEPMSTTTDEATTDANVETSASTELPMPTPATVGPPETTTGVPTPPAEDLLVKTTRLLPSFDIDMSTPAPVVRQRRAAIDTSVSYHCYTVQKSLNNTMVTNRGCSRVEPLQSVCHELQVQYNDTQLDNCDPCSMNACNSATSSLRSPLLATLLFALVAFALQRN